MHRLRKQYSETGKLLTLSYTENKLRQRRSCEAPVQRQQRALTCSCLNPRVVKLLPDPHLCEVII